MGDGAKAITLAGEEIFGVCSTTRLMCWAHVHAKILPRLKSVATHNKKVADTILRDIENLQWSALNEASFRKAFELLEKKYLWKHDLLLNGALEIFFSYMHKRWIDSKEFRWIEGSNPWGPSNNQGIEGKNKEIKQSHTFRRRLEIGELLSVMARLVTEVSDDDDRLLVSPRTAVLHGERDSLSLRTGGYQWFQANKTGMDKIIRIDTKNKYTVSEAFDLGKVDNLWVVSSTAGLKSGTSLKERAKKRIKERELPQSATYDDYLELRSSCWIIEERSGDFFCDCPVGMKVMYVHFKIEC